MPQTLPTYRTLDSSPVKGPWVSLGHGQTPPALPAAFGPPKFSREEQAANPDQPMTRLVKDVLRAGKWKVAEDEIGNPILWNVGKKTLQKIAENFRRAQHRGVAMNLGKGHGDPVTRLIHPDDMIAPIDAVAIEGESLWLSVYVTPEQARYLANPAMKVSPGVFDNWRDGQGNLYPTQLIHVAVTDSPVVTGQGPFVALSNQQSPRTKGVTMAEETPAAVADETTETTTEETPTPETPEMEDLALDGPGVPALIEEISKLLPGDVGLPADTTGETLVRDLRLITGAVMQEEAPAAEPVAEEILIDTPGDLPAELANTPGVRAFFAKQQKQIKTLSNQVSQLSRTANTVPRSQFVQKMQRLGRAGVQPGVLQAKLRFADKHQDYDLTQLDGLGVGVNMSNVARKAATGKAPAAPGAKQTEHTGIGRKLFGPNAVATRR